MALSPQADDTLERKPPTPAQRYADAVWAADADTLSQAELAMALCYANHAHRPLHDRAWVTDRRLMQQCKMRSAGTVGRVRDSLVRKGWLIPLHPETSAPMSEAERKELRRKTVTYRLAIPRTAPTIGAEGAEPAPTVEAEQTPDPAPTVEADAPIVGADEPPASAPMVEESAPIIEVRCSDDRSPLSSDSPTNPPHLSPAEQRIMRAVTATIEETREIISLMEEAAIKQGNPIGNLERYVAMVEKNGHLESWLTRARAARRAATPTPTPPPAADVLAQQAAHVPQPRGDDPPPAADESIAALRARIGRAAPKTRFVAVPERVEPPEVTAARAELVRGGDFPVWMEAAYAKLGPDAPRDEAVLLAAQLARAHRAPAQERA